MPLLQSGVRVQTGSEAKRVAVGAGRVCQQHRPILQGDSAEVRGWGEDFAALRSPQEAPGLLLQAGQNARVL